MSLIAYWPLISNSNDSVGSNNGVDSNITYSPATFNGTNSQVDFGNPAIFNFGTNVFSLEATFKTTTIVRRTIVSKYIYTGTLTESGFYIDVLDNGKVRAVIEGPSAISFVYTDSVESVNDGNWHTVRMVRTTRTTFDLYIDNVLSNGSTTTSGTTVNSISNSANLTLGYNSDVGLGGFSQNWDNQIKEVKIWDSIEVPTSNAGSFFQFF